MNHVLGEMDGKEYFKKLLIVTPPSSPRFMCPYVLWNHMITELCYYVFLGKKKQKLKGGKELWRKDFVKLANKEDKKSSGDKIAQIWA